MDDLQMFLICPHCGRIMQARLDNGTPDIEKLLENTVNQMLVKQYGEGKKQDSPFKTYLDMIAKSQAQWLALMAGTSENY